MEQWEYTDNGARLEECSLQAYGKYGYVPGYGLTLSTLGLFEIFSRFLNTHIPDDVLRLNKPVQTIFWGQESSRHQPQQEQPHVQQPQFQQARAEDHKFVDDGSAGDDVSGEMSAERITESFHSSDSISMSDNCEDSTSSNSSFETFSSSSHTDGGSQEREGVPSGHTEKGEKVGVKVVCKDGEVVWADHVIVTVSMGVLKRDAATLFHPALPEQQRLAVERMGFGTVAKVFLLWDRPLEEAGVLEASVEGVQMLWLEGGDNQAALPRPSADKTARTTKVSGYSLL
jgi:hypothetical protein